MGVDFTQLEHTNKRVRLASQLGGVDSSAEKRWPPNPGNRIQASTDPPRRQHYQYFQVSITSLRATQLPFDVFAIVWLLDMLMFHCILISRCNIHADWLDCAVRQCGRVGVAAGPWGRQGASNIFLVLSVVGLTWTHMSDAADSSVDMYMLCMYIVTYVHIDVVCMQYVHVLYVCK